MDLKVKKEMYQIQKASLWKRFAAGLLDIILILIIATGCMVVISAITGYDSKTAEMQTYYDEYEEKYNVNFDISKEEYEKLTEEEKKLYEEVSELITGNSVKITPVPRSASYTQNHGETQIASDTLYNFVMSKAAAYVD